MSRVLPTRRCAVATAALLASASCMGSITAPPTTRDPTANPPSGPPAADGWPSFAPARSFQLRRLTNEQYAATVQTLLSVSVAGMPAVERISAVGGFSAIGASTVAVSGAGVGQFENAARFLAHAAFAPAGPRQ